MTSKNTTKLFSFAALLSTTMLSHIAYAQQLPADRAVVDSNGVNLLNLSLPITNTPVSIGPAERPLAYSTIFGGSLANDNYTFYLQGDPVTAGSHTVYLVGANQTLSFTCNSGTCTPADADGTQLLQTSYDYEVGSWTYDFVARDGTRTTFDNFIHNYGHANFLQASAFATKITSPNGYSVTIAWQQALAYTLPPSRTFYAFRIGSVSDNRGYQLSLSYLLNTGLTSANYHDYHTLQTVTASNRAGDPPGGVGTAWPAAQFTYTSTYPRTLTAISDALGQTTQYLPGEIIRPGHVSPDIKYTTVTNTTGLPFTFSTLISSFSRGSDTWNYSYVVGASNVTSTVTDPLGHTTSITTTNLTPTRVGSAKDGLNRVTSYTYDGNGRLLTENFPEGNYSQYTYDARGNVTTLTKVAKSGSGLANIVTLANFDATCTNVLKCNKPNWTKDANGKQTDYVYSATTGLVTSITAPAPVTSGVRPQTRYSYAAPQAYYRNSGGSIVASGQPITLLTGISACQTTASCVGLADETKTTFDYGPQTAGVGNNLLPLVSAAGSGNGSLTATTTTSYDSIGNIMTVDGPLAGSADTIRYRFDAARQLVGVVGPDPDGAGALKYRAQRSSYNGTGQPLTVEQGTVNSQSDTDWAAFNSLQQFTTTYDGNARKIKDVLTAGGTTYQVAQYSYDTAGRLDCSASRMNSATWGSLPASACTLAATGSYGPDRISKNIYDAADEITKIQTGYGVAGVQADEVTNGYTNNGKVATVTDAEGNMTTYEYDGHDRLGKTRYPSPTTAGTSSVTDYVQPTYDANNNVTALRLRDGQSISFTYDFLNRRTFKNLPGTEPDVTYSYDNLGRTLSASQSGNSLSFTYDALNRNLTQSGPQGIVSYQYDLAGRRTRMTWPDSFYVTYDYLLTNEMTAIRENGAASGVGVLATYAYDDLGRNTAITRGNGTTSGYGFDNASRLTSLTQDLSGTGQDITLGFTYNPASQIATATRSNDAYAWAGHYNVDRNYSRNGLNQYTLAGATTLGYDGRGNLSTSGSSSYVYSSENYLIGGPGVSLSYDSLGRLYQSTGTLTTRLAYDGQDLIAEYNGSNVMQRRYVHGPLSDDPVVWYEGSGTTDRRWLHGDERGSVIAISNGSGTSLGINSYDEYGIPAAANLGRFQYTGQTWLAELGMYYYKARIYSPTLGRFVQTDPIGYGDGMNLYAYAGNDPVNGTDPDGLADTSRNGVVPTGTEDQGEPIIVNGRRLAASGFTIFNPINLPDSVFAVKPKTTSPPGLGGAGKAKTAPSRTQCALTALNNNKLSLALDTGAAALTFLAPEASIGASIAGSALGLIGIGNAVANKDATGAGIAYAGKQAAVSGGFVKAGSNAARIVGRLNVGVLAASVLYDSAAVASDYQKCMAGQ